MKYFINTALQAAIKKKIPIPGDFGIRMTLVPAVLYFVYRDDIGIIKLVVALGDWHHVILPQSRMTVGSFSLSVATRILM